MIAAQLYFSEFVFEIGDLNWTDQESEVFVRKVWRVHLLGLYLTLLAPLPPIGSDPLSLQLHLFAYPYLVSTLTTSINASCGISIFPINYYFR